jgi:hypothetical protein
MREKLDADGWTMVVLLGCVRNGAVHAAQQPTASEQGEPDPQSGEPSKSAVFQQTSRRRPSRFMTEVLAAAERGTAPRAT